MRPSLPIQNSVLHELGIADNELPDGLAGLKNNLLFSPSDTQSQKSNICTNSGLASCDMGVFGGFMQRLKDTIAEEKFHGQNFHDLGDQKLGIFISASYLDKIALLCLAAELRACRAPDCLQYRGVLDQTVPPCRSWPGLRDWLLGIISCSLRAMGDKAVFYNRNEELAPKEVEGSKGGDSVMTIQKLGRLKRAWVCSELDPNTFSICYEWQRLLRTTSGVNELLKRFPTHVAACIAFTTPYACIRDKLWEIGGSKSGLKLFRSNSPEHSQPSHFLEMRVSSRRCPCFTPEFLTCLRKAKLAPIDPAFIPKHLILSKREPVHQLMLQRSSS